MAWVRPRNDSPGSHGFSRAIRQQILLEPTSSTETTVARRDIPRRHCRNCRRGASGVRPSAPRELVALLEHRLAVGDPLLVQAHDHAGRAAGDRPRRSRATAAFFSASRAATVASAAAGFSAGSMSSMPLSRTTFQRRSETSTPARTLPAMSGAARDQVDEFARPAAGARADDQRQAGVALVDGVGDHLAVVVDQRNFAVVLPHGERRALGDRDFERIGEELLERRTARPTAAVSTRALARFDVEREQRRKLSDVQRGRARRPRRSRSGR